MSIKNIFTISLLIFIGASIVWLLFKNSSSSTKPPFTIQNGLMVYYFHTNTRCAACRDMEEYAKEAVESGFPEQLKNRKIVWQALNYETPGNEHFATDYKLIAPNVVLAVYKDGKQSKWKDLNEVVDNVDNKIIFIDLMQKNVREFLLDLDSSLSKVKPENPQL